MRSDIVTQCSCCGIHGCQRVTIAHVGGGDMQAMCALKNTQALDVDTTLQNNAVSVALNNVSRPIFVTTTPKDNNGINVAVSLCCRTSLGTWEYLLVEEGRILLIDGQAVMVKRKHDNTD